MAYLRMNANDTYQQIVDSTTLEQDHRTRTRSGSTGSICPTRSSTTCSCAGRAVASPKAVTVSVATAAGLSRRARRPDPVLQPRLEPAGHVHDDRRRCAQAGAVRVRRTANPMRVVEVTDPELPTEPGTCRSTLSPARCTSRGRSRATTSAWAAISSGSAASRSFRAPTCEATATKLSCSKTYSVSVRALDMISEPLAAATCCRPPRRIARRIRPICWCRTSPRPPPQLSWSDAGGTGTGFDTYLDAVHRATVDSTSYTYTGLKCGTTHVLGVASHDAAGHISTHVHLYATTAPC